MGHSNIMISENVWIALGESNFSGSQLFRKPSWEFVILFFLNVSLKFGNPDGYINLIKKRHQYLKDIW